METLSVIVVCHDGKTYRNVGGNILKCLISFLKGSDDEVSQVSLALSKLKIVEYVIDIIKSSGKSGYSPMCFFGLLMT
jgi:hypothetical protein